jgi:demethylmacrocin O-methyltransferase
MNTLSQISKKYPTDKDFTHNYYESAYEKTFKDIRNNVSKVCEIGIGTSFDWGDLKVRPGNSLKVWRDYFENAEILGLDIKEYTDIEDLERIKLDWIDQSKRELLEAYSNNVLNYDIIVDDGSHNVYDQTITFYYFFKSLKSGGIYVLEDLHSSIEVNIPEKCRIWGWGEPGFITPLEMLENFQKNKKIINDYLTKEEMEYLEENIASVEIYKIHETSITSVIIKK